jgi:3-methylcrotonyl-CoA carboxylase beta subunit
MIRLGTAIPHDEAYRRNIESFGRLHEAITLRSERAKLGGGAEALDRHREKGKRTARERIALLTDPQSPFLEIGLLAAEGMYAEYGGAPSAGVVAGIGTVHGRDVVIVANDATVKAGAWFPISCTKNLRAQEIAMENRLPIVYLVDSAGVFLPLQSEIFPDKEHFGRIFRNNAVLSSMGVPQIAAIMGPCVAGGAYLPIMSDETFIVDKTGSVFLAGSHLVKAAIGEEVDNESLGDPQRCREDGAAGRSPVRPGGIPSPRVRRLGDRGHPAGRPRASVRYVPGAGTVDGQRRAG